MSKTNMRAGAGAALISLVLSACGGGVPGEAAAPMAGEATKQSAPFMAQARNASGGGMDDVVVVAVIDTGFNPYHFDYLAEHMPQHLDEDPGNDLPLDQDPSTWVPGYPARSEFGRFFTLNLSLTPDDPGANTDQLHAQDSAEWAKVTASSSSDNAEVNMYWIPGTKVIGHVSFNGANTYAPSSHGGGSSSVSIGNLYGACPSCLFVFVNGTREVANEWVAKQDWIDAQTNSWGLSLGVRDRAYAGSDTELQREAVERGQQIFFSAGNGQGNAFAVPNTTLQSSQEGPDWIVTVGAISPGDRSSYSGHGKPADIASLGSGYPAGRGAGTTARGTFSGTSNATPVTAGMYAEALSRLRAMFPGPSRMQNGGVIATGPASCGEANPECPMADGLLTVHELRESLFKAAQYTSTGTNVSGTPGIPGTQNIRELEFMSEGHGSLFGRIDGDEQYNNEIGRVIGFVTGELFEEVDAEQRDWFIADSYCRQSLWGSWDFGEDQYGTLPNADPNWPVRTFLVEGCPAVFGALVAAEKQIN